MILRFLLGLVGLGVVVFVHEFGHFLAAKLVGIEVEAFSIGWGKTLFSFRWRNTEYRISLLPLGGYCKMKGEDALKNALAADAEEIQQGTGGFYDVSPLKRIFVAVAGPLANIFFAVVAYSFVWFIGFTYPTFDNRIILESDYPSSTETVSYPATEAGLKSGDYIVSVDGKTVATYRDVQEVIAKNPGKDMSLLYKRDGVQQLTQIIPDLNKETGTGRIGVYAWIEPVIQTVRKDSAGYIAGLKPNDRILAVNGKACPHTLSLIKEFSDAKSRPVSLQFEREGKTQETKILPHTDEEGRLDSGLIFRAKIFSSQNAGFLESFRLGLHETVDTLQMTVKSLGLLFKGINLSQAVSGPLRITYYVGEVAAQGFGRDFSTGITSILQFLSLLSVALFFMNLLPIPALDGGLIILFLLEAFRGKKLKPKFLYRYQYVGFFIVFSLIILSTMSDVFFFFRK